MKDDKNSFISSTTSTLPVTEDIFSNLYKNYKIEDFDISHDYLMSDMSDRSIIFDKIFKQQFNNLQSIINRLSLKFTFKNWKKIVTQDRKLEYKKPQEIAKILFKIDYTLGKKARMKLYNCFIKIINFTGQNDMKNYQTPKQQSIIKIQTYLPNIITRLKIPLMKSYAFDKIQQHCFKRQINYILSSIFQHIKIHLFQYGFRNIQRIQNTINKLDILCGNIIMLCNPILREVFVKMKIKGRNQRRQESLKKQRENQKKTKSQIQQNLIINLEQKKQVNKGKQFNKQLHQNSISEAYGIISKVPSKLHTDFEIPIQSKIRLNSKSKSNSKSNSKLRLNFKQENQIKKVRSKIELTNRFLTDDSFYVAKQFKKERKKKKSMIQGKNNNYTKNIKQIQIDLSKMKVLVIKKIQVQHAIKSEQNRQNKQKTNNKLIYQKMDNFKDQIPDLIDKELEWVTLLNKSQSINNKINEQYNIIANRCKIFTIKNIYPQKRIINNHQNKQNIQSIFHRQRKNNFTMKQQQQSWKYQDNQLQQKFKKQIDSRQNQKRCKSTLIILKNKKNYESYNHITKHDYINVKKNIKRQKSISLIKPQSSYGQFRSNKNLQPNPIVTDYYGGYTQYKY